MTTLSDIRFVTESRTSRPILTHELSQTPETGEIRLEHPCETARSVVDSRG
jgi:hypothetical protein